MRALILVDLQNDFCPGGALAVPRGDEAVDAANRLVKRFDLVVATQDWHPADHGSFAASHPGRTPGETIELGGLPQVLWPVHCVQDTPGAEFHPRLDRSAIARVFRKGTDPAVDSYSGLFDNGRRNATGLADFLRGRGVDEVYVCGLATDYCVLFTALDAAALGWRTRVIEDACRGVELRPGDVQRALDRMRAAGIAVISSDDIPPPTPRVLGEGRFLRLVVGGRWEWAQRRNAVGAVLIVAVTDDDRMVLVEQYRPPLGRRVIEMPAGLAGDEPGLAHEAWAEAARRELLEETGCVAESMEFLAEGPSSAGMTDETYALYLARGVRRTGPGGGVAGEDVQVHFVPLEKIEPWLTEQVAAGLMIDPKIYAGLYFIRQKA